MANVDRPNYFLLLGIDAEAPWDPARFEVLLRAKRGEWARTVGNGVRTSNNVRMAQLGLDHLDDIGRVMADPAARDRERLDARRRLSDERARLLADMERDLAIMLDKGFLWDADVATLRRNYPELATDPDQADRLDRIPTRAFAEQYPVPEQLASSTSVAIRHNLDQLGEKSLYTLLATVDPKASRSSTSATLSQAAKALYLQTQQNMNKMDQRLIATQNLAGHAMSVFGSDSERARYDNTLDLAPVVDLFAKYRSALGTVKRFEPGQVEGFLDESVAAGVARDVALAMLLQHFERNLKWTVLVPANVSGQVRDDQARCGVCQAWNEVDNQFCVVCGTRVRITCPSCDTTVPGHGSCGTCGFPVGDYDWATLLARECEELLERADLPGAQAKHAAAGRAWPSAGDDELGVRIGQCGVRLAGLREQRDAEDQETARQLRTLVALRSYHAALNRATTAPVTVPDRDRIIQESTEAIREADRLCDRAKRPGSSIHVRANLYTHALASCADHRRALSALSALPPAPPRGLGVECADDVVRLTWEPSSTDDVRYVVVRAGGPRPPASPADGSRIATVHRGSYVDRSPERGVPLHYAVFAQRATGTTSELGAVTRSPVFLTERVTIMAQRVDDGVVELEWRLPVHASGVAVHRTTDAGTAEVLTAEPTRLRDVGLRNGVSHTYTVRASYEDPHGASQVSAGVSVSLVPGLPPREPGPVHVRTVSRNLGLCYRYVDLLPQGAEPGTATLLWSEHRPPVRPGDQLPVTELALHGSVLSENDARGFAMLRPGLYYFAQVVIQHGVAYLGEFRRYAARDEVTDVGSKNIKDRVRFTWAWPDGCTEALVAHGQGELSDPTAATNHTFVQRSVGDRRGFVELTPPEGEQEFHVVIAPAERRADEVFVAGGTGHTATLTSTKPRRGHPRRRRH